MYRNLKITKNLGERIKEKRFSMGISIDEVVDELKIRKKYILAIEKGDFKAFSSNTYAKGFVKNYANYLGFEEKIIMRLFRREAEGESPVYIQKLTEKDKSSGINLKASYNKGIIFGVLSIVVIFISIFSFKLFFSFQTPKIIITEPFVVDAVEFEEFVFDTTEKELEIKGEIETGNSLYLDEERVETFGLNTFQIPITNIEVGDNTYFIKTKNQFGSSSELKISIKRSGD